MYISVKYLKVFAYICMIFAKSFLENEYFCLLYITKTIFSTIMLCLIIVTKNSLFRVYMTHRSNMFRWIIAEGI